MVYSIYSTTGDLTVQLQEKLTSLSKIRYSIVRLCSEMKSLITAQMGGM